MFVIITYDVRQERVSKVCKKLRKYLTHIQNSVFEGEITKTLLNKCLGELKKIINDSEDVVTIYKIDNPRNIEKNIIGKEKTEDSLFL